MGVNMIWFHLSMRIADIRWSVLTYLMERIGMGFLKHNNDVIQQNKEIEKCLYQHTYGLRMTAEH